MCPTVPECPQSAWVSPSPTTAGFSERGPHPTPHREQDARVPSRQLQASLEDRPIGKPFTPPFSHRVSSFPHDGNTQLGRVLTLQPITQEGAGMAPNGASSRISKQLPSSHPIPYSLTVNPNLQPHLPPPCFTGHRGEQSPNPGSLGPQTSPHPSLLGQQPLALLHKGSSVALPEILNEKAFVTSK